MDVRLYSCWSSALTCHPSTARLRGSGLLAPRHRCSMPASVYSRVVQKIKSSSKSTRLPAVCFMLSLPKKHTAGERVDLLDDYDFPARTIIEKIKCSTLSLRAAVQNGSFFQQSVWRHLPSTAR